MIRTLFVGLVCAFFTTTVWGFDLAYECPPGTKLVRDVKETGEFLALGDIPGAEQLIAKIKGTRKIKYVVGEYESDYALLKISGTREAEFESEDMYIDSLYDDIGPATLTVTQDGNSIDSEMPKFEADPDAMMQFGWWHYIAKQLDLVDGLPSGPVNVNDSWENQAVIQNPAGGTITLKTKSTVIGSSWNDGKCVWIHSKTAFPLDLTFKSEAGTYKVKGQVQLFSVACFNTDKGFVTGSKSHQIAHLSVKSKASKEGYGEDFSIQLVGAFQTESTFREEKAQAKAPSDATKELASSSK